MPLTTGPTAFVVLAAGSARRFGGGKLDADLAGRPLGKWTTDAVEQAERACLRAIVVSTSPPRFVRDLHGWRTIVNHRSGDGIGSSIQAAVLALPECGRIVFLLGDMPFVPTRHLAVLASSRGTVFTRHADGRPGVPAAFPRARFDELLGLGGRGAAALAADGQAAVLAVDPVLLRDVDEQGDIDALRAEAERVFRGLAGVPATARERRPTDAP